MLRTYHISSSNNQTNTLNIAERHDNTQVTLSINEGEQTAKIVLDYEAFENLCGLKYSLDLVEAEQNTVEPESTENPLRKVA
ncbi:MAG: hypothetical protein L3J75_08110 [Methylococcaceae bacterium]|nr:hypothetical protein [Methylococcaceae bacterium]